MSVRSYGTGAVFVTPGILLGILMPPVGCTDCADPAPARPFVAFFLLLGLPGLGLLLLGWLLQKRIRRSAA